MHDALSRAASSPCLRQKNVSPPQGWVPFLIPSFNDKKEDPGSAWSTLTTASRFVCDSQWSKTVLVSSRSKFHIPTRRVQQVPGALDCLFSCGSSWNFLFVWMFLWEAECQIIWRCTLWIDRTELTVLFWWKFVGFLFVWMHFERQSVNSFGDTWACTFWIERTELPVRTVSWETIWEAET